MIQLQREHRQLQDFFDDSGFRNSELVRTDNARCDRAAGRGWRDCNHGKPVGDLANTRYRVIIDYPAYLFASGGW